jgi:hypothetical protein
MNFINSVNDRRFLFNGIEYLKNYVSKIVADKIIIYNCYENKDVLLPLTVYSEVNLNGTIYASAKLLQAAILEVTYARGMGGNGGGVGTVTSVNNVLPVGGNITLTIPDLGGYDSYRTFDLSVTQSSNYIPIPFKDEKVTITSIIPILNVSSIDQYQLYKAGAVLPIRATLALLQADINAMTASEVATGYTIRFRIRLVQGQSFATAIFKSVKQL